MFRIVQGDVGSGKTVVSLLAISNVIEGDYQCALMGSLRSCLINIINLLKYLRTIILK